MVNKNVKHMGMGILLCSHFVFVRFCALKQVGKDVFVEICGLLNKRTPASSMYGFF